MRPIVVGITSQGSIPGLQVLNFWGRFAITIPARIAFYAGVQANASPSAPGDYGNADAQEIIDFRAGKFIERTMFDVIDPTLTAAAIEARLIRLLNAAAADVTAADNTSLQYYGSSLAADGITWTIKSA